MLIACTNLPDALDVAIARRFSHKIEFRGIDAPHRAPAVARYFTDWLCGDLPSDAATRLAALPSLYPGDLRAVRQQFAVQALTGERPHAAAVLEALEREAAYRKSEVRPIGFGRWN